MSRNIVFKVLTIYLAITMLTVCVSSEEPSFSWYCIREKNHSRPPLPSEFQMIGSYDGYYLGSKPDEKVVFLTFDAGYENGNVSKILDILKENNVHAAFFVLSHLIEAEPLLITRMADEGHEICNHTSTHRDMSQCKDRSIFINEIQYLERICKQKTGKSISKFFRPPEGRFNYNTLKFAKELGYKTIFWSFAYADWDNNNQMSEHDAIQKIMENIHNGAVLLLHPTSDTNAKILDTVIKEIKEMGYRFGTLEELTNQNA